MEEEAGLGIEGG